MLRPSVSCEEIFAFPKTKHKYIRLSAHYAAGMPAGDF